MTAYSQATPPANGKGIFVGPQPARELVTAVLAGGAQLSSRDDASAVIWYGGGPDEFSSVVRPGTRWVQLPNAGVEPWIAAGVITSDRVFTSAAGCYAPSVAEHALGLLLMAARSLHDLARAQTWTKPSPSPLSGTTVAIVGCGGIGMALIQLLVPFSVRILAVTRSGRQVAGAELSAGPVDLHDVLRQADYVVLAAPSTDKTRAMIGVEELAIMQSSSWLINVARGSLVDTGALVAALANHAIAGAALDVVDPEPLPDGHPLWREPRAVITPHSANTEGLLLPQLAKRVQRNVEHFLAGRPLEGVVNLSLGY